MEVKKKLILFLLILATVLTACGKEAEEDAETNDVLQLYTTIFPLEDFSKKIGGEFVQVTNLVPVGADAHTFEPTARDMIHIAEGDAFIYNGAGLEGFVDALLDTIDQDDVKIVKASAGIDLLELEESDEDGHDRDPHIWIDPLIAIDLAKSIKDVLIELMPEQEEIFTENFTALKNELTQIDDEFKQMVAEATRDTFLVSHAGYGYWEKRYGIHQIGITGISPTNEPSQRQLQNLIEYANEENIHYVMLEQNIPEKVANVVKDAIGAETLRLHNLEALTEEDVKNDEDYISLMEKNIEALQIALSE